MKLEKVVEINELLRIYGGLLTRRQFEVMKKRYNSDLSLGEIATELGISRQGVLNFENKSIKALRKYEKKLGVWAREAKIKEMLLKVIADEHARNALQEVFS